MTKSIPNRSTESSRSPRIPEAATSSSERHAFVYSALVPGKEVKPAVPIHLHSLDGKTRFPLFALPDSGADCSCFPEEWASPLGIDLAACEKRLVSTGAGKTYHHDWQDSLTATVAGHEIQLQASFGPVRVGILGRSDFFEYFRVEFDERAGLTYIEPYDGPASQEVDEPESLPAGGE